ncbi:lytic transglycosylase domain-containing protein [Aerolutibacter ruishenii]|uniref:Soluble lytic murein transglycosylase n=1 Tax=Aerolutibacter ruishenii TaxID=686800 RepID=A0A562LGR5_9GAMM|nr:lytic transglycosylase domain-containing protein [Lysobacter ruishenii]TWI06829.1 soluble lytic murein transglycosylase [Lysobacter ruishenii]
MNGPSALVTTTTGTAAAQSPDTARLTRVRAALEAAERGDFDASQYADLARDPLWGWIEHAALRRDIDTLDPARAQAFLRRHQGQRVATAFREAWLAATARREDWIAFTTAWTPGFTDDDLRCADLKARQALGHADAAWRADAQAMWRQAGKSLPAACDAPMAVLADAGDLPSPLRWERIDRAIGAGEPGVIRAAALGLPTEERALAEDYAAFLQAPHERALAWPKNQRSRRVVVQGLARLAKDNPEAAETQLATHAPTLQLDAKERGQVLHAIALWTVASYGPDSARRLAAVPIEAYDGRLHEWRVREAMARSDWSAALAALRLMPPAQRGDSRWQYFEARLSELTGDRATARRLYAEAARKPEFHGFLAADRIRQAYALCPLTPEDDPAARKEVARDPALVRALALYRLGRPGWAQREWDDALSRFDDTQRRMAVAEAQASGWFDRAVFNLGKQRDELRLYHLRFPLHHDATIRREATRQQLDPAWVAAEIRAESIFNPTARSSANAMGLMQVIPATGAAVASRIGLPWTGPEMLYDPDANIAIGTAYLRQLMDKYGGQPYTTIAGYNAGPAPLARWQAQRPGMDPDFWIETISYKETREYVARVLAFSVIYDWRLNGDAATLSDRLRGITDGPRKRLECPEPEAAVAPAPVAKPGKRTRTRR